MKYWYDCEFYDNGKTIDLISIGLVAEDGREYYAETTFAATLCQCSPWLMENVLPHLNLAGKRKVYIATEIMEFVGEEPEFWSYCGAYDWVALCQLYGTMLQIPNSWPHYSGDLAQLLKALGKPPIPPPHQPQHNALVDARWHKAIYDHLLRNTLGRSWSIDPAELQRLTKEAP